MGGGELAATLFDVVSLLSRFLMWLLARRADSGTQVAELDLPMLVDAVCGWAPGLAGQLPSHGNSRGRNRPAGYICRTSALATAPLPSRLSRTPSDAVPRAPMSWTFAVVANTLAALPHPPRTCPRRATASWLPTPCAVLGVQKFEGTVTLTICLGRREPTAVPPRVRAKFEGCQVSLGRRLLPLALR